MTAQMKNWDNACVTAPVTRCSLEKEGRKEGGGKEMGEEEEEKGARQRRPTCLCLPARLAMNGPSHGSRLTVDTGSAGYEYILKACT